MADATSFWGCVSLFLMENCAEGAYTAFGNVHLFKIIINGGAGVYFGKALLALKSVGVDAD